jgi:hypothetical protein
MEEISKSSAGKKAMLELSAASVKDILKSDNLNMKEGEVFGFAVNWAREEIKRSKAEEKKDSVKKILEDTGILTMVRFPAMTAEECAAQVRLDSTLCVHPH